MFNFFKNFCKQPIPFTPVVPKTPAKPKGITWKLPDITKTAALGDNSIFIKISTSAISKYSVSIIGKGQSFNRSGIPSFDSAENIVKEMAKVLLNIDTPIEWDKKTWRQEGFYYKGEDKHNIIISINDKDVIYVHIYFWYSTDFPCRSTVLDYSGFKSFEEAKETIEDLFNKGIL